MDVARSLSTSPQPAATPEPHYRLSRLISPQPSASLRPPSIITRSVSAGLPFAFKSKDKEKEKEKEKEIPDLAMPGERVSSRFGFNSIRKKRSLASLLSNNDSSRPPSRSAIPAIMLTRDALSSSSGRGSSSATPPGVSPIDEAPTKYNGKLPMPPRVDSPEEDPDLDADGRTKFVEKTTFHTRRRMKLHPYSNVPYMQSYEPTALQNEQYTQRLLRRLLPASSPTFHDYGKRPPASALDLGCGTGQWLLDAARMWPHTHFTGLDIVNVALGALEGLHNVHLVRGDFLNFALPFADGAFELVRLANVTLAIPRPRWEDVLREAHRVLALGGRLELVDDQTFFPYGDVPAEEADLEEEEDSVAELPPSQSPLPSQSPSTPHALPPVPPSTPAEPTSGFFDSSGEEDDDSDDSVPERSDEEDVASKHSHSDEDDTASTLVGDASDRGSITSAKKAIADRRSFADHKPFTGIESLMIAIPPPLDSADVVDIVVGDEDALPLTPVPADAQSDIVATPTPTATTASRDPISAALTSTFARTSTSSAASTSTSSTADSDAASLTSTSTPADAPYPSWKTQRAAARVLEGVFSDMLAGNYDVHLRPAEFADALLARVFVGGRVEPPGSWHLKLAPCELAGRKGGEVRRGEHEEAARRKGVKNWMMTIEWGEDEYHREGKERKKKEKLGKKLPAPIPIPQGLAPKAAARLEDDEDYFSEDEEDFADEEDDDDELVIAPHTPTDSKPRTPGGGASTWVAPSEWEGPAALVSSPSEDASTKSITAATSSCTITAATSAQTIRPAVRAQTIKAPPHTRTLSHSSVHSHSRSLSRTLSHSHSPSPSPAPSHTHFPPPLAASRTHTRGGSTGSYSSSATADARTAAGKVQHPGLILWPATFIPLSPMELEMHACKHVHTLLGCKPALGEYVARFADPATGRRVVSEEQFEDALWEYECFRRPRFNWPELPDTRLDAEVDADLPTPASATGRHSNDRDLSGAPTQAEREQEGPFGRHELTHVRTVRVFSAVKGDA
ncbi:hypothetical protein B0H10DRAFT_2213838 [Mycena sp. CBHHK59/15]|nr:hypothetical protein B0H10DRAFT_2213838 [Mycena sp. CBHHK59/15]